MIGNLSWSTFKSLVTTLSLSVVYWEDSFTYYIYGIGAGDLSASCVVIKGSGSDTIDFETNIKPTANAVVSAPSAATITTRLNTLGQKTMAASAPVVIASDQAAIPVSGSFSAGLTNNRTGSGTIVALNQMISANVQGCATVTFTVSGVYSAILVLEGSVDGVAFVQLNGLSHPNGSVINNFGFVFPTTGTVSIPCAGFVTVRLNCISYTSGTASVVWASSESGLQTTHVFNATAGNLQAQVQGPGATAAAKIGNPVRTGAVYNSALPTVGSGQTVEAQATSRGAQHVAAYDDSGNVQRSIPSALTNKMYGCNVTGTLVTGGVDAPMCLIRNPVGSGKKLRVLRLFGNIAANGVLGAQDIFVRLRVAPTITATGTAGTIISLHLGGGAPASSMQVFLQPTASALGTIIDSWLTASGAAGGSTGQFEEKDFLVLEAGQDLIMTGTPDGSNRAFCAGAWWFEE